MFFFFFYCLHVVHILDENNYNELANKLKKEKNKKIQKTTTKNRIEKEWKEEEHPTNKKKNIKYKKREKKEKTTEKENTSNKMCLDHSLVYSLDSFIGHFYTHTFFRLLSFFWLFFPFRVRCIFVFNRQTLKVSIKHCKQSRIYRMLHWKNLISINSYNARAHIQIHKYVYIIYSIISFLTFYGTVLFHFAFLFFTIKENVYQLNSHSLIWC